ncbi:MAG: PilZ domain-containing protein [Nitrospirae bacterium]|nr:PilZ domain-containing protein [Nitrospirota bacterium]
MKKRTVERIPANLKAEFFWSDKINSGSVTDLSENGMLVNTTACPPLRAKFDISIPLKNDVVKLPVKVRRILKNDSIYDAIGLEILNPPKQYLDFVSSLRWEQIKGFKTSGQIIKLYICKVCHHISFDHAPINCPICSATIESFERAPEAIKRPDNFAELSEFEKKHIPAIKIMKEDGYINVHVKVGEIEHGMDFDDHISFIDLYYNDPFINKKCVSRITFNCAKMHPSNTVRFNNVNEGVLTVISNCSAHGNWLAKAVF